MTRRHAAHLAVSILLTLLLVAALSSQTSVSQLGSSIRNIDAGYFAVFVTCSLTALFVRALRYRRMLSLMQDRPPSFGSILLVTGVRNAFVDFLPARLGEASYIYFLNRLGVSVATGLSTFGLCIAIDLLALMIVAVIFLVADPMSGPDIHAGVLVPALGVVFAAGVFVLRKGDLILEHAARKIPRRLERAGEFLRSVAVDVTCVKDTRHLAELLGMTVLLRAAKYTGLYMLTLSVLHPWNIGPEALRPLGSFGVFVLSEASASLPVSGIMGFGMYEGVWSMLFSLICQSPCAGVPGTMIAFTVHVLSQIVGYGAGILCLTVLAPVLFLRKKPGAGFALIFLSVCFSSLSVQADGSPEFEVVNPFKLHGRLAFSASLNGRSGIYILDLDRLSVKEISPAGIGNSYPAFSPDGRMIAFSRGREGRRSIAVTGSDGQNCRELVSDDVNNDNPSWSPAGDSVVFYREDGGRSDAANLFLAFPESPGQIRKLTDLKKRNTTPQWSPDGRKIAFSTDRFWPGWDVCIWDLEKGDEKCPLSGMATYCRPRFDHSGRRLAYSYGTFENIDLFVRDLEKETDVRITSLKGREYDATWSPDNEFIAFTNNSRGKEDFELYVVRLEDFRVEKLLLSPASIRFLSWTAAR